MKRIIVDSYALLVFFNKEPSFKFVQQVLKDARDNKIELYMSVFNLAEVYYRSIRVSNKVKARELLAAIRKFPITIISATEEHIFEAAEIKGAYPIAFGDCFAIALAKEKKAPILTGDP